MNKKDLLQQKVLEHIRKKYRCSVVLGTGSGKTLLVIKDIANNITEDNLFLIVIPRNNLIDSYKDELLKHGYDNLEGCLRFINYRSLHKENLNLYDKIYLDECHNLTYNHEDTLDKYQGPILGLTGTYPKYDTSEKGKMCNKFCPKTLSFKIEKGIKNKMLNDYIIYVHMLDLNTVPTIVTKKGRMSERNNYFMWNKIVDNKPTQMNRILRMKAIQSYTTKVDYTKSLLNIFTDKTIVFTELTAQADSILPNTIHTKNKNSKQVLEDFKNGAINKIATVQMISEGVNIPNLKNCIILHSYANERKFSQRLGRMLRLNPNETANIHLLVYKNTIDEEWAKKALADFDNNKIKLW